MRISVENITLSYDAVRVLDGVTLEFRPGELVGLIGPNGAGKTSLLRIAANLQEPGGGSVRYDDDPASAIGERRLARRLAFLAQDAHAYWPLRADAVVALGRLPHRRPMRGLGSDDKAAIDRALIAVDADRLRGRTLAQMSGGERMRVLLARALAVEAEMLLADEPTASLDPAHQIEVIQLLRRSARDGRGVVVVMHDLSLAARFCDRVVLLAHGKVKADGPPMAALTDGNLAAAYGIGVARGTHDGVPFILPWASLPAPGGKSGEG